MPVSRKPIPSYLPHSQSGRARAVWYDASGLRRQKLLPGDFDSAESRTAFARLQLEIEAAPSAAMPVPDGLTVAELLCGYLDFAEGHYRYPDGKFTSEIYEVRVVLRALRELYADIPAATFGPLALKAARQKWIADGRSRSECNRRVGMVKRIFKWAASEELVPASVHHSLATVSGLQRGRTRAPETAPIRPVEDSVVDATVPYLNRYVRGLVAFQRFTGCRPGEACALRRCDLDMSRPIWMYRPPHHKNTWRGKPRTIAVGPQAQEMLNAYITPCVDDYLFSPRRAVDEQLAARTASRKTPRWRSHMARNAAKRKQKPKRTPAAKYDRGSYGLAIDRACDKAFPLPDELAPRKGESRNKWWARLSDPQKEAVQAWCKLHRWHPNQLRHSFATRIRKQHGLEAAQVLLGHTRADVTQVYAERNEALATRIAATVG